MEFRTRKMRSLQSEQGFWLSPQKVDDSGSESKGQLALHTKQCTSRLLFGCCNLKRQQEVFERAEAWESRDLGSCLDSATNETFMMTKKPLACSWAQLPYV